MTMCFVSPGRPKKYAFECDELWRKRESVRAGRGACDGENGPLASVHDPDTS